MYHDFQNDQPDNKWEVPFGEFKEQMTWLKQGNYYFLNPEEAYYVLTLKRKPADNLVWVTMDDGYKSWNTNVLNLIKETHINVTGFQITNAINQSWNLTTSQLKELQKAGMSIQSHTVSHKALDQMTPQLQFDEAKNSFNILNESFGNQIISFRIHSEVIILV